MKKEKTSGGYCLPETLMEEQQPFACWLHRAGGVGGRVWKEKLLEACGTPEEVYRGGKEKLKNLVGEARAAMLVEAQKQDVYRYAEQLREKGICFYPFYHPGYPKRLLQIPDRPFGIFVKGSLREEGASIAIVGARDCSAYGSYAAREFGASFAAAGVRIVSGMARGVDGIAQTAAWEAGGNTCAVLGCGVDVCYPASHRELYEKICESGGAVSEYPPGTRPYGALFPARNRIISGLADLLLVVEARQKSGTLITVDMALEQGKEVFAVPGRITDRLSEGCNSLISQGASVALSPGQLLEELFRLREAEGRIGTGREGEDGRKREKKTLTEQEEEMLSLLGLDPVSTDQLRIEMQTRQALCGLTLAQTYELIFDLEKKGLLRQEGGFLFLSR